MRDPVQRRIYEMIKRLDRCRILDLGEVEAVLGPVGTWQWAKAPASSRTGSFYRKVNDMLPAWVT